METRATTETDDSVIVFEEGILGVPRARRFQLLERPDSDLRVLRCLDVDNFSLPVVDPRLAAGDYEPRLNPRVARALGLEADDPVLLLAVTTIEPDRAVANLRAPIVINVKRRRATQVILDDRSYPVRAPLARAREAVAT